MSDQVNLKQLAKELNLAVSTVSRALRDSYEISEETKKRVFSLARKLNYEPNPYASSLRLQKSKTLAVVMPEIINNFFSLVINGVEAMASEKGYHVLIYLTHDDYKKEISSFKHLLNGRVDGVLLSCAKSTTSFSHVSQTVDKDIPVVLFDRSSPDIDVPQVITDNYQGGFKATSHLIANGCRRIAYLSSSPNLSTSQDRMKGYMDALRKHKIPFDSELLLISENGHDRTKDGKNKALYKLLQSKERPDGIFASVEKLAITSYHFCNDLGIDIPGQVKVICFANLETAPMMAPPMTTVVQPAFEMGKEAARILFRLIEKRPLSAAELKTSVLDTVLIERESSRRTEYASPEVPAVRFAGRAAQPGSAGAYSARGL
jgi:LacI family transcriptional regulator